jgi:putative ABC transport system permease protein
MSLRADIRFAFRYFARHKSTTAIIIAVLALSTGANTFIFSAFQSEFLRPAPAVPDDPLHARIFAEERPTPTARFEERGFTQTELRALESHRETFDAVAAWSQQEVILSGDSTYARGTPAQYVTSNYFQVLGVPLVAGAGLRPAVSSQADLSAVMSHLMATQLFADPARAVGQRVLVNEIPVEIVGVAAERFQGALKNMDEPALFMPLSARATIDRISERWADDSPALMLFARLTPEAPFDRATALTRQVLASTLPDSAERVGLARNAHVVDLEAQPPGPRASERYLVFAVASLIGIIILLVAWMNVGSLMVAAAVARRHEIAVRLSLGASRARLVRQLITESTLLALAGGALGLLITYWGLTYAQKTEIDGVSVIPDALTYLFVFGMAVVTGVLFGLSPALHATTGSVANAMRDSGASIGGRSRLQRGFVVAQIALSQPLLVILGVMLTWVITDFNFLAPEMSRKVISVSFRPNQMGAEGQRPEAVMALLPRIAERPEVEHAVPKPTAFAIRGVMSETDTTPNIIHLEGAAPGWFDVVEVPIVLGRDVAYADTNALDYPIVIGSDMARAMWGEANPIGRRLKSPPLADWAQDSVEMTVVGVYDATVTLPGMQFEGYTVPNSMAASIRRVYTARGAHWLQDHILVRTRGPAESFVAPLQTMLHEMAPSLPVTRTNTLAQIDEQEAAATMRVGALAGAGGALALLLASLGLYGVISLAVRQRTREIGVRIAVGAEPMQVARLFLRSGVTLAIFGLLIGLPLSLAAMKVLVATGNLVVPGANTWMIGGVIAALLVTVAAVAAWMPARRAALVDPAISLRAE